MLFYSHHRNYLSKFIWINSSFFFNLLEWNHLTARNSPIIFLLCLQSVWQFPFKNIQNDLEINWLKSIYWNSVYANKCICTSIKMQIVQYYGFFLLLISLVSYISTEAAPIFSLIPKFLSSTPFILEALRPYFLPLELVSQLPKVVS